MPVLEDAEVREGELAAHAMRIAAVRYAASDTTPISGSTHLFYRYPARFSPRFAAAAIEAFSKPGDLVVDPFMGGGTTIVEAVQLGRRAVGNDINALSLFLARVKTTPLGKSQARALHHWADCVLPKLRFADPLVNRSSSVCPERTKNLHLPQVRALKKLIALALETLPALPDATTRRFARCALLNVGQWALNGRRTSVNCSLFRARLQRTVHSMLSGIADFRNRSQRSGKIRPVLLKGPATDMAHAPLFQEGGKADLVVMSPPYQGIHILYHRWQVDGRKESPAPYWITASRDGKGPSHYNLGDRRNENADDYFDQLLASLCTVRNLTRKGGIVVQLVAFGQPERDLPRYLSSMITAGFRELPLISLAGTLDSQRLWRTVPRRAWHATSKGRISAAREVVLIHVAS